MSPRKLKAFHRLTSQGKRKRLQKMVPEETAEENVQINQQVQDCHTAENHKEFMDLPGSSDEKYESDSSKSSTTSFPNLNPIVMPSSTTNPPDKVQSVFEILDTCAFQDSDDSDCDSFTRESDSQRLQRDIRNWSVQFAVTHVAVSALLTILKAHDCFKSLPSDARTLKETPTSIELKPIDPGNYCHIGIAFCLKNIWSKVVECVTSIELQSSWH